MGMKHRVGWLHGVNDTLGRKIPDMDVGISAGRYQFMAGIAYRQKRLHSCSMLNGQLRGRDRSEVLLHSPHVNYVVMSPTNKALGLHHGTKRADATFLCLIPGPIQRGRTFDLEET